MRCVSAVGSRCALSIVDRVELGAAAERRRFSPESGECCCCCLSASAAARQEFTVNRGFKPAAVGAVLNACVEIKVAFLFLFSSFFFFFFFSCPELRLV